MSDTVTFHCERCFCELTSSLITDYSVVTCPGCGTSNTYVDPAEEARRAKKEKYRKEGPERKAFCRSFVLARAGAYSEGEMRLSVAWENARKCWEAKPEDL